MGTRRAFVSIVLVAAAAGPSGCGALCMPPPTEAYYRRSALVTPSLGEIGSGRAPARGEVQMSATLARTNPDTYLGEDGDGGIWVPTWYGQASLSIGVGGLGGPRKSVGVFGGAGSTAHAQASSYDAAPISPSQAVTSWIAGLYYDSDLLRDADGRWVLDWEMAGALESVPTEVWRTYPIYPPWTCPGMPPPTGPFGVPWGPFFEVAQASVDKMLVSTSFDLDVRVSPASAPFGVRLFAAGTAGNAITNVGWEKHVIEDTDPTVSALGLAVTGQLGVRFELGRLVLTTSFFRTLGAARSGDSERGLALSATARL